MTLYEQVEQVLEAKIRPLLHSHGGEVELLDCMDGVVSVRLLGGCAGCPSADFGTRSFIEDTLRAELSGVCRVELDRAVDAELLDTARRILAGSAAG